MHSDLFYQKILANTRFSNRKKASSEAFSKGLGAKIYLQGQSTLK